MKFVAGLVAGGLALLVIGVLFGGSECFRNSGVI
jgi:hypothetical protein